VPQHKPKHSPNLLQSNEEIIAKFAHHSHPEGSHTSDKTGILLLADTSIASAHCGSFFNA
jgi:hypothetical protein